MTPVLLGKSLKNRRRRLLASRKPDKFGGGALHLNIVRIKSVEDLKILFEPATDLCSSSPQVADGKTSKRP